MSLPDIIPNDDSCLENLVIDDIPPSIYHELCIVLENNDNWKKLLAVGISCRKFKSLSENIIKQRAKRLNELPSKILLRELASRWCTISEVIDWLERIHLEEALLLLKSDEPLIIVKQPPSCLSVESGPNSELILECLAVGFPSPKYQWYKNNEILNEQSSKLRINELSSSDSGKYVCAVYKHDREMLRNSEMIYSAETLVTVFTRDEIVANGHLVLSSSDLRDPRADNPISPTSVKRIALQPVNLVENERTVNEIKYLPRITHHPVSPAEKVAQGSSISLTCIARDVQEQRLNYQWFCDGIPINRGYKERLILDNLYPECGKTEWIYCCEVSNRFGRVVSKQAKVCLAPSTSETQYYAQDKVALLLGNQNYSPLKPLRLPSADIQTLAEVLTEKDFKVLALENLSLTEMRNAVELFSNMICAGAYVVFYFVGHGFEEDDCYMLPIEANTEYLKKDSLGLQYVMDKILQKDPRLALFLLDVCRKAPNRNEVIKNKGARSIPLRKNVLIGYATSPMTAACEKTTSINGIYMEHLKVFLRQKRPIWDILLDVNRDMESENQTPWNAGNLSRNLMLDDPIIPSEKKGIAEKWNALRSFPRLLPSEVKHLNLVLEVICMPHLNVFSNSMDILINISKLNSALPMENLHFHLETSNSEVPVKEQVLKVHGIKAKVINLQKLQDDLMLKLVVTNLRTKTSSNLQMLLKRPMIAKDGLWVNRFHMDS